ncbi:MAG: PDZ domain-containing protein [Saprospiraceae bacterium]|nr:PDZ domain-containing protein [Saprospiraceae bacterium]
MKHLSFLHVGSVSMLLLFFCATISAQERTAPKDAYLFVNKANKSAYQFTHHDFKTQRNPCKVFIGVGTSTVAGGLRVDYTVDDTPASIAGVQPGDVITALDGTPVSTQTELVRERDKHQQGEAFTLTLLRDGKEMRVNARFKECSQEELEAARQHQEMMNVRMAEMEERMEEMRARMAEQFANMEVKERPILGVYEDTDVSMQGMVVKSVIRGKGAEAAGLRGGDVVVNVGGKPVTGGGTLRTALAAYQPGDRVTVVFLRDGNTIQTELTLSGDRNYYSFKSERDPCKVFIGIYTSDHAIDGRGARVTGVIDDTPAKEGGVQPGDVILALDGQPVSSHTELLRERDKHQPGDAFRLTVLRDGSTFDIDATFKSCTTPTAPPKEEKVEVLVEDVKADDNKGVSTQSPLLESATLEAYPNPTVGPLNIRFDAEAVPTTLRIMDASGKVVYDRTLNQFSGSFNERINLFGNTPGIYVLTAQQGSMVISKKIVLMPQA